MTKTYVKKGRNAKTVSNIGAQEEKNSLRATSDKLPLI